MPAMRMDNELSPTDQDSDIRAESRASKTTSDASANFDPGDPVQRKKLLHTHPVVQSEYTLPTPPIVRVSDIVVELIATRKPGCSFAGYPRFGKTAAINYLARHLPEIFPTYPIVNFIAESHKQPRETIFFKDLYQADGQILSGKPDGDRARDRLVRKWFTLAKDYGSNTIIFLGDEMQRLSIDELTWLVDIGNQLSRNEIRVISIFFGSAELVQLRNVLRLANRGDIIGRFMSPFLPFNGICSLTDLSAVLRHYDDPESLDYPAGSGCCLSRFFVPRAYASGWRLEGQSGKLWYAFELVAEELDMRKLEGSTGIGMQWVAHAIEHLLIHSMDLDRPRMGLPDDIFRDAVLASGFADSLGLLFEPSAHILTEV